LQLNDPNEYEGGNFEIMTGKNIETIKLEQGEVIVFPSYILHRVTEITKGTRNSLVGLASGKPFK
jgi:PKHD-type hydroxylase